MSSPSSRSTKSSHPILCDCKPKKKAPFRVVKRGANEGRWYYCCSEWKVGEGGGCGFFRWAVSTTSNASNFEFDEPSDDVLDLKVNGLEKMNELMEKIILMLESDKAKLERRNGFLEKENEAMKQKLFAVNKENWILKMLVAILLTVVCWALVSK